MVLVGGKRSSVFDLETEIENLIKSAPNNANSVRQPVIEIAVKLRWEITTCVVRGYVKFSEIT